MSFIRTFCCLSPRNRGWVLPGAWWRLQRCLSHDLVMCLARSQRCHFLLSWLRSIADRSGYQATLNVGFNLAAGSFSVVRSATAKLGRPTREDELPTDSYQTGCALLMSLMTITS